MKKKYTKQERAAMFEPTFMFGYGSLLSAKGINGRGMGHRYTNKELLPCELRGYERSMCGFYQGRNFYGLLENKNAQTNGVVFKIYDWYDYRRFLISEGAIAAFRDQRTYWPVRVTNMITGWKVPKGHRVITLMCKEDKSLSGRAESRYISLCHAGAQMWGAEFEKRFLSTGGVPYIKKRNELKKTGKKHNFRIW